MNHVTAVMHTREDEHREYNAFPAEQNPSAHALLPSLPAGAETLHLIAQIANGRKCAEALEWHILGNVLYFFKFLGGESGIFLCIVCITCWNPKEALAPQNGLDHTFNTCMTTTVLSSYKCLFKFENGVCYKCCLPQEKVDKFKLFKYSFNQKKGMTSEADDCHGYAWLL